MYIDLGDKTVMKIRKILISSIMQLVIFILFLIYGVYFPKLLYCIGSSFSLTVPTGIIMTVYFLIGVLCISLPNIIIMVKYDIGILFSIITLPIIYILSYFIHPDGIYGIVPTYLFGTVPSVTVATFVLVQVAAVEIIDWGIYKAICYIKGKIKS